MEVERITVSGLSNPGKLLSEVEPFFPEEARDTINHERAHAAYDKNIEGGEFGYSAVLVKLPNGYIMASWIAWYQPWGEREPEEMMDIATGPGWNRMSDQDLFVYEQARKEHFARLCEKQKEVDEENPVPILEVIPGKKGENEDEYKKRAELIIKFGEKLEEMSEKGELPPMSALIEADFAEIYDKYLPILRETYEKIEEEINNEKAQKEGAVTDKKDANKGIKHEVTFSEKEFEILFGIDQPVNNVRTETADEELDVLFGIDEPRNELEVEASNEELIKKGYEENNEQIEGTKNSQTEVATEDQEDAEKKENGNRSGTIYIAKFDASPVTVQSECFSLN